MQIYAGMIDCIDQNIGRVISYLESVDKLENTLIMFASDNGACASTNKPPRTKRGPLALLTAMNAQIYHGQMFLIHLPLL